MSETETDADGQAKPGVPVENWIPHPASDWMDWLDEDKKYPMSRKEYDAMKAAEGEGKSEEKSEPDAG